MSRRADDPEPACEDCLRRSWLLARLSVGLDYRCIDVTRLMELLVLDDERLMHALAGRRRATLRSDYLRFDSAEIPRGDGVGTVCRHDAGYPSALRSCGAPPMLYVLGGPGRLGELLRRPAVAVVGSHKASDYGAEMARSLGRGLSASGVTIVSGLSDGIAVAAQSGALEAGGAGLALAGGGLDVGPPARRRSLVERLTRSGCVASELPCGCEGRRWSSAAAERIVAHLAKVTVVVEASDSAPDLASAAIARSLGRTVAAVPGRVTSRSSRGTNALLMDGARLVRGAQDVLELLHIDSPAVSVGEAVARARLEPRLVEVLEQVGEGRDTADKLIDRTGDVGEVLLALSELELLGLLTRGEGGRYVPRP
ncbi:MAG TPA: DNA-processing protein DprA [Solirubrobacteraceae bacterium]|jgi:DNA processing protein|nr:DNA-processing protein DprA [Solirubrobacteraceae bacterium]